jgi:hypothetical protein
MSSFGRRFPFFTAIIAVALGIFTTTASADTYKLILVGGARTNVYGIDGSGDLVVTYVSCPGPGCYQEVTPADTFFPPTALPPSLAYDNGSPCTGGLPAFFSKLGAAICNNGHEVFGGEYYNPVLATTLCAGPISGLAEEVFCGNHGELIGLFTGFDPFADWFSGSGDMIVLNAAGDFGVVDGRDDQVYLAIDQTPEPNTLLLVGAGCLSLFSVLRRRVLHH